MSGALGLSKSARFPGMNCGRRALLWSPRFRRKRDRALAGANCGRGAALRLGRGLASIGAAGKRRAAVKGRAAAKRSDVYPLRRTLFCQTGRRQRSEGATKGAGPDQGLSWEAEHRPSADGGRAWRGGETGGASCRAAIPPGWDGWLGGPA